MSDEQARSSKVARLSTDHTATATPIMLGLGLGLGLNSGGSAGAGGGGKTSFTFMQMQELEQQALIYKYMVAGLPVPFHLVLPIWKSVAASAYGGRHYPSLIGGGSLCFDYQNIMEPEPGRCRRTDGKKWRCSRDVVPDQKYCERHVHRGRNRSRKPVDAIGPSQSSTSGLQLLPATYRPNSGDGAVKINISPAKVGFSPESGLRGSSAACTVMLGTLDRQ